MFAWETKDNLKVRTFDFNGSLYPFQHKGALFLASVRNCLLIDKTGLGKTIQFIASFDILRQKYPNLKLIVFTLASTQIQWANEFKKFLPIIKAAPVFGTPSQRAEIYEQFAANDLDCIILNYSQILNDYNLVRQSIQDKQFLLCFDEIQKCKNVSSKTAKLSKALSNRAYATKGLTATPIFTHLIDIYGIFKIINDAIFINKQTFKKDFCVLDFTWTQWGSISGYKNHDKLKQLIAGKVFGRTKKEVAIDLPNLISKDLYVDLPRFHREFYEDLERGINRLLDEEDLERNMIATLIEAQVCSNAIENLNNYKGKESHPKIDEAVRVIQEELYGDKTIVFSKFKKTIDLLDRELKRAKVPAFKITGSETIIEREDNRKKWSKIQGTSVLLITTAGGAGLNLQKGNTLVLIDRPWSIGELEQIRGRIHRIGSKYKSLLEINIIVKNTIDQYVLESLQLKKENVEKVFGEGDDPIPLKAILKAREKCRKS